MEIPLAAAERMLKKGNMRVSDQAILEFATLLEETTADIASEADASAKRARRKTVGAEDVREAKRKIL